MARVLMVGNRKRSQLIELSEVDTTAVANVIITITMTASGLMSSVDWQWCTIMRYMNVSDDVI